MIEKKLLLYRLSLIKYIFENGLYEFKKPEPLCVGSLLMFHDAVELFLHLCLEHHDIKSKSPNFSEYWELIDTALTPIKVTQRESMRRLNNARVAFKHHGTIPSRLDLEFFQGISKEFFVENCTKLFDIDFSNITLLELIRDNETKENLVDAFALIEKNDFVESIIKSAISFDKMIKKYENNKLVRSYRSVFNIGADWSFISGFSMRNLSSLDPSSLASNSHIYDFVDKVKNELDEIKDAMKIIGFGLDFRKHAMFKYICPNIGAMSNGEYYVQQRQEKTNLANQEQAEFCVNFCIESYLKLVSFDFEISKGNLRHNTWEI